MRFRSLLSATSSSPVRLGLVATALLGAAASLASDARAGWPPPESATCADLTDPANWPNDPGYGPKPGSHPGGGDSGRWEAFCFVPERSKGASPVRAAEKSAGMSVDMAWRYTTGDPRVLIGVTDSGIKWDEADLVEKAFLNVHELANHKPMHADDSPCGGTGELAGFDCNGDGQLTVADYADTSSLTPAASSGHALGDRNGNGHLDAGDLIANFSDGVDDDGNGYVDDISGWDFMKDDNDPYDDTRYGHGTGEAKDSTAAANNGIGDMGLCPSCRFVPLRVGDSFITDVNDFAQAAIYITDLGGKVIQSALGTINNSTYAMAALDYAYAHGVTFIASMADENSRHHNMPTVNNHALPTHAITPAPTEDATSATSFVAFNLCTNYGAHNFLSASSVSCSSGAVGNLSGMTGLVYSASLKFGVTPPLSAGEVMQLWTMNADDIDVPESREESASYFWSQPGFDQRFGYGRPNANRAIEAIKAGKIPPVVDVTSPYWYEVLYPSRTPNGRVAIQGTVSAPRAAAYDWWIEVAPGVQPLDDEFVKLKNADGSDVGQNMVPGATVSGATGDLASFDIASYLKDHGEYAKTHPDPDSPNGENAYTVTMRVVSVAHYGGSIGDVRGEMRRAYAVHEDTDLAEGFPIRLGGSAESSPKVADLDGDGVRELVLATSDGKVHAWSLKGGVHELPGFPFRTNRVDGLASPAPTGSTPVYLEGSAYKSGAIDPDVARESIEATPGIADVDGDGKPEIVVSSYAGTIYVIGNDGQAKPGWPKRLPEVPSCPTDPTVTPSGPCMSTTQILARGAFGSPVLVDMNKDGKADIVQTAFDGRIYVFDGAGNDLEGWPVLVHYNGNAAAPKEWNRLMTTPAAVDVTGDGIPELVVGSNEKLGEGGGAGAFYIVDGRGTKAGSDTPWLTNWPITITSLNLFPLVAEGVPNSAVVADFTGDGKPEVVVHGNASPPEVLPVDPGPTSRLSQLPPNAVPCHDDPLKPGSTSCGLYPSGLFGEYSKAAQPNTMLPLFAQPSLGDIDQDGTPDVIATGGSLNLAINLQSKGAKTALEGQNLLAIWSGKTGKMLPGSPVVLEDFTFFNSQAVADISGDGYPEVFTGSGGYYVHAVDGCGREAPGWPKFTNQWVIGTPAIGDLDGDGTLEVATASRDGFLYAWHTPAKAAESLIEWESYHHDNANTGNLAVKLDQGKSKGASTPLVCPAPEDGEDAGADAAVPPAAAEAPEAGGGGCSCEVRRRDGGSAWALAALGLGLALARRRRKS